MALEVSSWRLGGLARAVRRIGGERLDETAVVGAAPGP